MYVNKLVELYERFQSIVDGPFKKDEGFQKHMDQAMTVIINNNAVTALDKRNSLAKSPELLARYCDILLRKNIKSMEEEKVIKAINQTVGFY